MQDCADHSGKRMAITAEKHVTCDAPGSRCTLPFPRLARPLGRRHPGASTPVEGANYHREIWRQVRRIVKRSFFRRDSVSCSHRRGEIAIKPAREHGDATRSPIAPPIECPRECRWGIDTARESSSRTSDSHALFRPRRRERPGVPPMPRQVCTSRKTLLGKAPRHIGHVFLFANP